MRPWEHEASVWQSWRLTACAAGAHLDPLMLRSIFMKNPVSTGRNQFRLVGDLIDRDEADAEGSGRARLLSFVAARYVPEAMEVAAIAFCWFSFPRALNGFHYVLAVAKSAVVFDEERVLTNIKHHRGNTRGVIGILNQFVRKRGISLEVPQLRAEIAEVVDPT